MNKIIGQFLADTNELLYAQPCEKSIKHTALGFAIFALLGASIGIPFSGDNAYYVVLFLCSAFLLCKAPVKISPIFAALYIVIFVNVLIIDIPPFFKPFQRAVLFVLLTFVSTASLESANAIKFRAYLFRYIIYGMIIIGVGSFFCFFLGINLMSARVDRLAQFGDYTSNGGWFSGLASHSMILGPIAMVSALTFYFLYQKNSLKLYLALFFFSAMSAVMASSRAAILALVIAILYNLIVGKVNATVRKRMIGILAVSALLTIPISGVVFKGVINKQHTREKNGGINSRQGKFEYRINEFKSSPIFGVGFCAIDINSGDMYDKESGHIEPGSSHLSALSTMGLIGVAVYLCILYKAYNNTRKTPSLHSRYVFSCFVGFFVHAWFEGYIFSGGGFLALSYWLIIGQCIDCPSIKYLKSIQQRTNLLTHSS